MSDPSALAKRVIVIHACGLWQIVGRSDPPYPSVVNFSSGGGLTKRPSSLLTVKPRYVLYREIIVPETGRFNEFHPEQV